MVKIIDLKKNFGDLEVLKGVNLEITRGKVCAVIGSSGSGKSTMLRCVNILEQPTSGTIQVCDKSLSFEDKQKHTFSNKVLTAFRSNTGMVFQQFNLFPHMTVLKNVMEAPVQVKHVPVDEAKSLAMDYLEKVGLTDKADVYPAQLSGGQAQRVAIARALAMKPHVMLFDEVTSALDPELVGEVLGVIKDLAEEGMTMMIVTHEIAFAQEVADLVCFIDEGIVMELGSPKDVLDNPSNPRLQSFLARFRGQA
jgi:polar amino acid transport system ATP-binding protein